MSLNTNSGTAWWLFLAQLITPDIHIPNLHSAGFGCWKCQVTPHNLVQDRAQLTSWDTGNTIGRGSRNLHPFPGCSSSKKLPSSALEAAETAVGRAADSLSITPPSTAPTHKRQQKNAMSAIPTETMGFCWVPGLY